MRAWLSVFRTVFLRELSIIRSDRNILMIVMIAPLFYALFYSTIYMNKSERDVPIAVVNLDHSDASRALERRLDAHQLVRVALRLPDLGEARALIEKMEIYGVVYIPKDYGAHLSENRSPVIKVWLNTTRFLVSNDINKAINEVVLEAGSKHRMAFFNLKGINGDAASVMADPVMPDVRSVFNVTDSYGDFLIPGLLMLILQQTLLFGLVLSISKDREAGGLVELWRLSKGMFLPMAHGKIGFYVLLFAAWAVLFYGAIFWIFSVSFTGSAFSAIVLTLPYFLGMAYLAVLAASFFRSKLVAFQVFVFTSYPLFLMSGLSWPVSALPLPLQIVTELLPGTPYVRAMMRVTQMGAGPMDILPELAQLAGLLALYGFLMRLRVLALLHNAGAIETELVAQTASDNTKPESRRTLSQGRGRR